MEATLTRGQSRCIMPSVSFLLRRRSPESRAKKGSRVTKPLGPACLPRQGRGGHQGTALSALTGPIFLDRQKPDCVLNLACQRPMHATAWHCMASSRAPRPATVIDLWGSLMSGGRRLLGKWRCVVQRKLHSWGCQRPAQMDTTSAEPGVHWS